jgi:hypothetical protein
LIGQLFDGDPVASESWAPGTAEARIVVRADAARPGLAADVASLLQRRGYNAWVESEGIQIESAGTFIASRREAAETAVLIAGLLRVGPEFVMLAPDVEEGLDIVLTLGRDFVIPN